MYQRIREWARLEPGDLVHDLGTGSGAIALFLARLGGFRIEAVGPFDFAPHMPHVENLVVLG